MDKEMRALHDGFAEKRTWHKIKWMQGEHTGNYDILDDSDLEKHKNSVEIIETFRTDKCATGVALGFGKTTESQIDTWILENRR